MDIFLHLTEKSYIASFCVFYTSLLFLLYAHTPTKTPMAPPATCRLITNCHPGYVDSSSSAQAHGDTTCPICLNHFESQESVFRLYGCHHVFHEKCIIKWLSRNNTCPLCRRVMPRRLQRINLPLPHDFRLPPQPPLTMKLQLLEQHEADDGTNLHLNFYVRPKWLKHEKHLSQSEIEYLDKIFSTVSWPNDEMCHDLLARACGLFSIVRGVSFR
ncbi:hypothetical protein Lser_V15G30044 [Lactuca serriola]